MPSPVVLGPMAYHWLDLKAFGERIAARDPDRQTAEIQIRVALMNPARPSERRTSFASADAVGERAYHASGVSYATTPNFTVCKE